MLDTHKFSRLAAALVSSFLLGGCASLGAGRATTSVTVAPSDRLYFEVAPFDSAAVGDLSRSGLDPARVAEDVNAEIRYQLALRGQEEARAAGDATVSVKFLVRRLEPGAGNSGAFGSFALVSTRGKAVDTAAWEWRARARENVPESYVARHLARTAAKQALDRMKARPAKREPAPPLILL
jgi:hypothetical protein